MKKAKAPMTNAERQAAYRKRHLESVDGEKRRLSLFVDLHAHAQLERLARHKSYTVTALIEEWAAKEEQKIISKLTPKEEKEYFAEKK
jgi:hypothetical protein